MIKHKSRTSDIVSSAPTANVSIEKSRLGICDVLCFVVLCCVMLLSV